LRFNVPAELALDLLEILTDRRKDLRERHVRRSGYGVLQSATIRPYLRAECQRNGTPAFAGRRLRPLR
jgi:hypothetical protein